MNGRICTCVEEPLAHLPAEDHASTRATQGFVGGGGHHISVVKGGGQHSCCHKATVCVCVCVRVHLKWNYASTHTKAVGACRKISQV